MAKVLTVQRLIVPLGDRAKYMERAKRRRAFYADRDCRFWIVTEVDLPGAFIEFTEGPNAKVLKQAHLESSEPPLDVNRIYAELEF